MNKEEKLKKFTSDIEAQAQAISEKILAEIREETESAMKAAEDDVLNEAFRHIKNRVAAERTEAGRKVSRHMMERKTELGKRREDMAADVMDKVRLKLAGYVKTPEYVKQLQSSAESVVSAFGGKDTVLYLRAEDIKHKDAIIKAVSKPGGGKITVETGAFEMGGLMAACPATHMQIDESFDGKFGELRGHFAELFGLQLTQ